MIAPAWAKDANGRPVSTDYEVSGSALVQTVQITEHTRYPVVSDPTLAWKWYGAQIRFSRSETRYISYGATACAVVAAGIPDPTISKIVAISCGACWADRLGQRQVLGRQRVVDGHCLPLVLELLTVVGQAGISPPARSAGDIRR
mgnify:CR=1 FL=1